MSWKLPWSPTGIPKQVEPQAVQDNFKALESRLNYLEGTIPASTGGGGFTSVLSYDFSTNPLADFTFDQGTSSTGLSVSGGEITTAMNENVDHSAHHTTALVEDSKGLLHIKKGHGAWVAHMYMKYIDDNNYAFLQADSAVGGGIACVIERRGGTYYRQSDFGPTLGAVGSDLWMTYRMNANRVRAEVYESDPRLGFQPAGYFDTTVDAMFGAGVQGSPGFRLLNISGQTSRAASISELSVVEAVPTSTGW